MVIESPLGARLASEFVGSAALVAVGIGSAVTTGSFTAVAVAHGLVIAAMLTATGHVSGGHFNPVITLTTVLFRLKSAQEGALFVLAQLVGAWVGAAVVAFGLDLSGAQMEAAVPSFAEGQDSLQALVLVAVGSFLLLWTVWGVGLDRDGAWFRVAGLPIGIAVTASLLLLGPENGPALATTRWFGPALYSGTWDNAYVWLVAPVVGGVLAAAAYVAIIRPRIGGTVQRVP
ncbi:MAG: major intrinsic protein [Thermoleophilia bacterium]|nr:major intrinsic protein [Thermoleophilia bacterium]